MQQNYENELDNFKSIIGYVRISKSNIALIITDGEA
jgi:hypothetical protein